MELLDESVVVAGVVPREAARRTLAMRIAHRNRLRAERLARLRPGFPPDSGPGSPAGAGPGSLSDPAPPVTALPPAPEATATDAGAALEEFLQALTGATGATGDAAAAAAGQIADAPPAAEPGPGAVLHFQRPGPVSAAPAHIAAHGAAPGFAEAASFAEVADFAEAAGPAAPPGDLARLPGMGPSLIWAFQRAGIPSLADLARLQEADLVARLGPLGRLVPAAAWLRRARDAAGAPES
jgi:hypothetical protein